MAAALAKASWSRVARLTIATFFPLSEAKRLLRGDYLAHVGPVSTVSVKQISSCVRSTREHCNSMRPKVHIPPQRPRISER